VEYLPGVDLVGPEVIGRLHPRRAGEEARSEKSWRAEDGGEESICRPLNMGRESNRRGSLSFFFWSLADSCGPSLLLGLEHLTVKRPGLVREVNRMTGPRLDLFMQKNDDGWVDFLVLPNQALK
jgi:hypothetical protein